MGQLNEFSDNDLPIIDPARLAHRGDPCIYCCSSRDQVESDTCPVLVDYFKKIQEAQDRAIAENVKETD